MGIELIELRTNVQDCEFILRETIANKLVDWKNLPNVKIVKEYLQKYSFPKDKFYSEEQFIEEIKNNNSFIHIVVEKRETAQFIREICNELFAMNIVNALKNEISELSI